MLAANADGVSRVHVVDMAIAAVRIVYAPVHSRDSVGNAMANREEADSDVTHPMIFESKGGWER